MDFDKYVEPEKKVTRQKTTLLWDKYMDYLIEAIDESKFMKRSESKPMATPKDNLESHLTSRATHVRNAANIAKRIAKGLGLNYKFAYTGMLMHDAGHPFSAHEGEDILTHIGELYNCQYFHHNAKGVEVILSEDICTKAIDKIPYITPKEKEQLEEEFYYFLDIVISHDGESNARDMYRAADEYPDIKTAVDEKAKSAGAKNKYKFIAQTPEGKIAKFADVIAYLPTDIQDGFRMGIYKDFPDDYLELFGEMFSERYLNTREEKITFAKELIAGIKEKKVRELLSDATKPENRAIMNQANIIIMELEKTGINYEQNPEEATEFIEKQIEQYMAQRIGGTPEEKQFLFSDMEKLREFIGKKLTMRSAVVAEITTGIQEYFINDLLKESHGSDEIRLSNEAQRLFFRAKELNYKTYVPHTRWGYQRDVYPEAARKLVEMCAQSLLETGAIRNKFYDKTIREAITREDAKRMMKVNLPEGATIESMQRKYEKAKQTYGIKKYRILRGKLTGKIGTIAKQNLVSDLYSDLEDSGDNFVRKYSNTYDAIQTQIEAKVKKALDPSYSAFSDKEHNSFKELLTKDIERIRERIKSEYGFLEPTPEQEKEIVAKLVAEEREKMEEKMAIQISIDYIAGLTDRAFSEIAIRTGCMSKDVLDKAQRIAPPADGDKKLEALAEAMKTSYSQPNPPSGGEKEGR